ncbi:PPK2 family polyphosphate kinase [Flectobacillus major]|uniref:PPK2 family polyphosphate kinase n=1 Tax=Flectobacillus major TaxID=103 RepID=UPI0003FD17A5|nr:phosphate--nucleotide phosphotransferase [Flectobacillus major]
MKDKLDALEFDGQSKFETKNTPTKIDDWYTSEEEYQLMLGQIRAKIDKLQSQMYAHDKYGMVLIFQALDAAGKDGTIKAVLSGINPAGVVVHSFKRPSDEELGHDFMWRNMQKMASRGQIAVHNRSYYEEVLVVKVHPEILTDTQKIPAEFTNDLSKVWDNRYDDIRHYEEYLHRNGILVVKFFLNVSKKEQSKRLIERIQDPEKNWKFEEQDVRERAFWKDYQKAYEELINKTATKSAPWYVVPADDKKNMRLIVASIVLEKLKGLKMEYPESTPERRTFLQSLVSIIEEQDKKN